MALGPTQPPIQWVPRPLSLGVKRPGREADRSLPSTVEVKNAWRYTSSPQYAFMAQLKHRDNFTSLCTNSIIRTLFEKFYKIPFEPLVKYNLCWPNQNFICLKNSQTPSISDLIEIRTEGWTQPSLCATIWCTSLTKNAWQYSKLRFLLPRKHTAQPLWK
jgi:hypothetical protein